MECGTCQELTKLFIDDNLPDPLIFEYCSHLESCQKCKEDLIINYAIANALRQLNENGELSSDYGKEVEEKLKSARNGVLNKARMRRFRRLFIAVEIIGITFFTAFFPPIEKKYAFLPENSEDRIVLTYYGIPTYLDPVIQGIYRYNDEVIQCMDELQNDKGEH